MPSSNQATFSLFSSLRYDPLLLSSAENTRYSGNGKPSPFYMLSYHRDRMLAAATHFSWDEAATAPLRDLEIYRKTCEDAVDTHFAASAETQRGPLRVKMLLSPEGKLTVELNSVPKLPSLEPLYPTALPGPSTSSSWKVHVDAAPTQKTAYTTHKTSNRDVYDTSRERVGIKSLAAPEEVFLWNEDEEFMEGSLTTCYFLKDGKWVTPPLSSGGNSATTRRWALENKEVVEDVVKKKDVKEGDWVAFSNGVRGFFGGPVVLSP